MKNKPRILAIIPARSGSKRLKNKNILPICGKPMYDWTLDMVKESKLIDRIVIATDIKEILNRKIEERICLHHRSKKSAQDNSPLDDVLREVVNWQYETIGTKNKIISCEKWIPDLIVMTHCNIPIRKEGEIDKLIKIALKNPEATAVCTGTLVEERPEWMFKNTGKYFKRILDSKEYRKQDMPDLYSVDGAIQIHKTSALMIGDGSAYSYFGDKIIIVPHERKYGLEIDTIEDFNYVEYLMKGGNK